MYIYIYINAVVEIWPIYGIYVMCLNSLELIPIYVIRHNNSFITYENIYHIRYPYVQFHVNTAGLLYLYSMLGNLVFVIKLILQPINIINSFAFVIIIVIMCLKNTLQILNVQKSLFKTSLFSQKEVYIYTRERTQRATTNYTQKPYFNST